LGIVAQVVVYIHQTGLLRKTLNEIHAQAGWMQTQAGYMKSQTTLLSQSVIVAQTSATAALTQIKAMKDKERARISVEIQRLDVLEFGAEDSQILVRLRNFGYTHALNVRVSAAARALIYEDKVTIRGGVRVPVFRAFAQPLHEPLPLEFGSLDIPTVILNGAPPSEAWVSFIFPDEWWEDILLRPRIAIELRGIAEYEDVFEDAHFTKFSYTMRIPKFGEISPEGRADIRPSSPYSIWIRTRGEGDNEAT
jgi:hypothetical protein